MLDSIYSIAIMEPFDGKEQEFLSVLHELYSLMERKGYSSDSLYRDRNEPPSYVHVRHWTSIAARQEAHEDPELHRCWAKLGHLCQMRSVHQMLDEIDWRAIERVPQGEGPGS
jgi:quinol monooxygenase YgiN